MRAGLYIHVPFCRVRCPFCDFAITTDRRSERSWLEALLVEMDLRAPSWLLPFHTVYLGGGTPSLLGVKTLEAVLHGARSRFQVAPDAEVTLEANPGTLGEGDLARLRGVGVNRLSLGVQSFEDRELELLGRDHTARESVEAFERARREGFENISIDLMYGLPGGSASSWEAEIERARQLGPEHVSAYQLTYEPGTPFTRRKERGELREVSEEEARDLFLLTRSRLEEAGYRQYEVSSFARTEEHESRHNRIYWEGGPYLGLGPSAHSFQDGRRSWNTPAVKGYVEALEARRDPRAGTEVLTPAERGLERIFLGLRTSRGLPLDLLREESGTDLRTTHRPLLEDLLRRELAVLEGGVLRLTARGLAVADAIALRLGDYLGD